MLGNELLRIRVSVSLNHNDDDDLSINDDLFNFNNHPKYDHFLNLLCDLKPRQRASNKNGDGQQANKKTSELFGL